MISGGSGMIGWALAQDLARGGHEAILLSRGTHTAIDLPGGIRLLKWDAVSVGEWAGELETTDVVVNLAGENISAGRWTKIQKDKIIASRVNAGQALTSAIKQAKHKPAVLIQASGVGAYGISEEKTFSESDGYGSDFQSGVTRVWEASTQPVESMGVRRVVIRSGVVFASEKGALGLMLLPFKLFVGGKIGTGRQWLSWIHLDDEIKAIRFLMENEKAKGIINLTAEPVTNGQFAACAGKALHRPVWFPLPGFVLRLILGELSTLILEGQNVSSKKLQDLGYRFIYPKIDDALFALV